eukprot:jgi/Phyca11/107572/e_gw1.14.801.1
MVHRYFALLEFLDQDEEELQDLLPSAACNRRLKTLYADLKDFESVSKALQAESVSLLDVRVWFDGLIEAHPAFAAFIGTLCNVTKWSPPHRREAEPEPLVQRLEKRRRLEAREARYCLVGSIPATSNKVERFFSIARTSFGHERNGLQPITLEMILFLRENSRFWDVSTVDQLL